MAPPLSFATTSTWSTSSASRSWTSISAWPANETSASARSSRVPVAEDVGREAAAHVRHAVDHAVPEVGVEEHPVDEERGRAGAPLDVRDASRGCLDAAAVGHAVSSPGR